MKLLEFATESIVSGPQPATPAWSPDFNFISKKRWTELTGLLLERNGFYAFESALLFRPFDNNTPPFGLVQWNDLSCWKNCYNIDLREVVFFAEDIFGCQFSLQNDQVCSFNPETGDFEIVAATIQDWANWVVEDTKARTGWSFGHFWQLRYGALNAGERLLPKKPFALGGGYAVENFHKSADVEGMRYRASIANQLKDCPDGSSVVIKALGY